MGKITSIGIIAIAVVSLVKSGAAKTHVVGDGLGWVVPPGGDLFYATWAAINIFTVGDVLLFNFRTGDQDVARVSKEAYLKCNSTNPILTSVTTGPTNFTLDKPGEYFFISTMDKHCLLGQRLAIYVIPAGTYPAPAPHHQPYHQPPMHPNHPINYIVGDGLGWLVPPGGSLAYMAWAYNKTFLSGDTLVFNFVNGLQDVALVSKEAYESCNTNTTLQIWSASPAKVLLNATGDYFFTSTYPRHCILGQQLAITVVAAAPESSITHPPSISSHVTEGPTDAPPPFSSASSPLLAPAFSFTLFTIALAFF